VENGKPAVEIDPNLAALIKSAGAPVVSPPIPKPPRDLPGELGLLKGIGNVIDSLRIGTVAGDRLREKYGDLYRFQFLGIPMVAVWNAEDIHKILKNEEQVWSTAMGWDTLMFEGLDPKGGNLGSLLSLDFADHRVARKLVQPAFTLKAIEGYLAILDRGFAPVIAAWRERKQIEFKPEVRTLLAKTALEIFTGIQEPEQMARVDRALSEFWRGMMALSRNPWVSPTFRKSRRGLATLLKTFLDLVPERREKGGADLFSRLCQVRDTDGLSDEAMVRVFITIMFGAFDTTSAGLTSMGYLLAKHPEWQERLRGEALAVGANAPDVAAMKKMTLTEWAWKETLRLMPVNGFLPRRALREVVLGGYRLAPGTFVAPMNGSIGHHPKWWSEPDKFDPERFSPERAEDQAHPGAYNPFGAGPHACVGMQLANMEVKMFWHRLLSSCRFRLTTDYVAGHSSTPMGIVTGAVDITLAPL
jgi:cytochrome P450